MKKPDPVGQFNKEVGFMSRKLHILWTSNDVNTAHFMVFMYAINALTKHWWDEVTVIVWGASAKLVAENKAIQDKIEMAKHQGVKVSACIACATQLGVVDKLKELGL
ncbi:MAG: DsrE family protein, partial [Bacillota bacterium]|nr:DsrE family protein [Bacillota bacterium]